MTKDVCSEICGDGLDFGRYPCEFKTGDTASERGCSKVDNACVVTSGWSCSGGDTTKPDACYDFCGDGKNMFHFNNNCDNANGYGCDTATCTPRTGFSCTGADGSADSCTHTCGDGVRAVGPEACDDGNSNPFDGCTACSLTET